jgi:hypothetical protein
MPSTDPLNQDFMATLQKRIAEWTSIGKDVAQIIALMGVGLWTLFVYLRTENPSTAGDGHHLIARQLTARRWRMRTSIQFCR